MGLGGYLAARTDAEHFISERAREEKETEEMPEKEAAEVVPAEMLEAMTLVGPEGYIKEKVAAFKESGVTNLQVMAVNPEPIAELEKRRAWND